MMEQYQQEPNATNDALQAQQVGFNSRPNKNDLNNTADDSFNLNEPFSAIMEVHENSVSRMSNHQHMEAFQNEMIPG